MIYVPVDGERVRVKRAYKGVGGDAICVASDDPSEIGKYASEIEIKDTLKMLYTERGRYCVKKAIEMLSQERRGEIPATGQR